MSLEAAPNKSRLNSWKEIAAYFGNDQRTVKRWEGTRGLPVRRLPGARSGVYALLNEIEAWQRGETVSARNADPADLSSEWSPLQDSSAQQVGPKSSAEEESAIPVRVAVQLASGDLQDGKAGGFWYWPKLLIVASAGLVASVLVWQFHAHAAVAPRHHVPPPHARELYLQGRFLWDKRTPEALKTSLANFGEATRIDPQYAAAYAGVADCYALSAEFAPRPSGEVYPRMLAAAQKALMLDGDLAEGHRARAFALFYWNLDLKASRLEFEHALKLAPNDPTTHLWFANTLATSGHWDEALAEIERAREINPTAAAIVVDRGWILYGANRRDEALQVWTRVAQTDPGYSMVHVWMAEHYYNEHHPQEYLRELEAIAALRNSDAGRMRLRIAKRSYEEGGEPAMRKALALYEQDLYRRGEAPAYMVALAMMQAGERDAAMDYLETAYRTRDQFTPGLNLRSVFSPLHGTPRFQKLIAESEVPFPEVDNPEIAEGLAATR